MAQVSQTQEHMRVEMKYYRQKCQKCRVCQVILKTQQTETSKFKNSVEGWRRKLAATEEKISEVQDEIQETS